MTEKPSGVGDSRYKEIRYDIHDRILTITLDRPAKLNAFTDLMRVELVDAFDRADQDDDVRAIVVTGAGRAFCAGADLSSGGNTFDAEVHGRAGHIEDYVDNGGIVSMRIFRSLKPVIAAINGPAVGVGVTMTLPMDVRLASDSARFGFVFTRRGIVPDACSSWFLPRVVGMPRALEWVTTGRLFSATEALGGGLVQSVHAPDRLLPRAYEIAQEITENTSAVSVALARQMMWRMLCADDPGEAHRVDSSLMFIMGRSADAREGVESFLQKRPARFPMRVSVDMPEPHGGWKPDGG